MKIRLLLGDQLNPKHSWFTTVEANTCYVMMEMQQETNYIKHHIQKVVAFFAAMRNFAKDLEMQGHQVHYIPLDAPENTQSLTENLSYCFQHFNASSFEYQWPDEFRLDQQLKEFTQQLDLPVNTVDTEHFLTSRTDLQRFFEGKKQRIMEFFYRDMRKKYNLLMQGEQPEGGQWNYDKSNRNKWKGTPEIPPPYHPKTSSLEPLVQLLENQGIQTFGTIDTAYFLFPTSVEEAQAQLDYFCTHLLCHFGDYQDAMHTEQTNLFHARISFALNAKMLHPLEVVKTAIDAYRKTPDIISLSQTEGFVRQIIGWREYMRGIYWAEMPEYKAKNHLENTNPLPDFYWTGKTKMSCLQHSINNSLEHAYAHHIQRLMIIGNFALLAQIHPDAVDQWYLGVYADAIEWVQLPNTRGMSQWADGGIVATKPYISAAAYINKMGNYCGSCSYNKSQRTGETACPFNSLYWNFLDDKKELLKNNNRMSMMLRLLEKIPAEELYEIKSRAATIIANPDAY